MEAGTTPPHGVAGTGYTGASVAGAVLATLFFPLIALIAALLLQRSQTDPRKKSQLRTWAWASVAWMVFWVVLSVVLVGVGSGSGSGGF
jgi:uncharacterized membrane protein